VVIRFGSQEVYPTQVDAQGLANLSNYMRGKDVRIHVSLATGTSHATVWGCDLTDGYVRINADYTT
jgi:glutamate N-acetyltransferase/amino-acid N-acetyltransferase